MNEYDTASSWALRSSGIKIIKQFPKINYSRFMGSIEIPLIYDNCHVTQIKYKYEKNKTLIYPEVININFKFYDKKINKKKCILLINFVLFIINILVKLNNKKINDLNIDIINYNLNKTIPNDGNFRYENINSGWSMLYFPEKLKDSSVYIKSDIVIFRKEELYKVIIHELIHSFRIGNTSLNNDKINKLFPNEKTNDINEAIVESYACILNNIIYNMINNNSVIKNIKKEQEYCLNKAIIINNIVKNKIQNTNVVSYYILKSLLLYDLTSYNKIKEFIKNIENDEYIINKIFKHMNLLNKNLKQNKLDNMKMCSVEIKTNSLYNFLKT